MTQDTINLGQVLYLFGQIALKVQDYLLEKTPDDEIPTLTGKVDAAAAEIDLCLLNATDKYGVEVVTQALVEILTDVVTQVTGKSQEVYREMAEVN